MKLHLPKGLRTALIACVCVVGASTSWGDVTVGNGENVTISENGAVTVSEGGGTLTVASGKSITLSGFGNGADSIEGALIITTADNTASLISHSTTANALWGKTLSYDLTLRGNIELGSGTGDLKVKGSTLAIESGSRIYVDETTLALESSSDATKGAAISIAGGALHAKKGISVATGNQASITMSGADSKLLLGAGGITSDGTTTVTLKSGTLGGYESWSSALNMTLGDAADSNATFTINTGKYDDATKTFSTTTAASITLNGNLSIVGKVSTTGVGSVSLGTVTNTGALTVGSATTVAKYDVDSTGSISIADGATLTISALSNHGGDTSNGKIWNLVSNLTTTGTGQLIFSDSFHANGGYAGAERTINASIKAASASVNSYYGNGPTAQTITIGTSGRLEVTGDAEFLSKQTLKVQGALVVGGTLKIGHGNDGDASNDYHGELLLESGSLKAGVIHLQHKNDSYASSFKMTGGTLELTKSDASAIQVKGDNSTVTLEGGTLKATLASWYTDEAVTLGGGSNGLQVVTTGNNTITFSGATTVAGTITNNGKLNLTGPLTLAQGTSLTTKTTDEGGFYSDGYNGYKGTSTYLVEGAAGSELAVTNKEVTNLGTVTVTGGSAYVFAKETDAATYYVNSGQVDFTSAKMSASDNFVVTGSSQEKLSTLNVGPSDLHGTITLRGYTTVIMGGSFGTANGNADTDGNIVVSGTSNTIKASNSSLYGNVSGTGNLTLQKTGENLWLWSNVANVGSLTLDGAGISLKGDKVSLNNSGVLNLLNGVNIDASKIGSNVTGINVASSSTLTANSDYSKNIGITLYGGALSTGSVAFGGTGVDGGHTTTTTITLKSDTNAEGKVTTYSSNTISGSGTAFIADIAGHGNVTMIGGTGSGNSAFNVYGNVNYDGTLTLGDGTKTNHINFGNNGWGGSASIGTTTGDITIKANTTVGVRGATQVSNTGDITLEDGSLSLQNSAVLKNTGDINVQGGTLHLVENSSSKLQNTKNINISGGLLKVTTGTIDNGGDVNISGGTLAFETGNVVSEKTLSSTGSVNVSGTGALDIQNGVTVTSTIKAQTVTVTGEGDNATTKTTTNATFSAKEGSLDKGDGTQEASTVYGYKDVKITSGALNSTWSGAYVQNADIVIDKQFEMAAEGVNSDTNTNPKSLTLNNCTLTVKDALQMTGAVTVDSSSVVNIGEAGSLISDGSLMLDNTQINLTLGSSMLTTDSSGAALSYTVLNSAQLQGGILGSGSLTLNLGAGVDIATLAGGKDVLLVFTKPSSTSQDGGISTANEPGTVTSGLTFTLGDSFENTGFTVSTTLPDGVVAPTDKLYVYLANANKTPEGSGTEAVPEPTTATLSLLALAALAARRRRK